MATGSLRRRVTIAAVSVFAVVLVAAVFAVGAAFTFITNSSMTSVLTDHVQLAEQLAAAHTSPTEFVSRLETHSVRCRLVLADGEVLGNLRLHPDEGGPTKTRRILLPSSDGELGDAQVTLEVDGRLLAGARARLVKVLLVVALIAVAVIALGIPVVVRYALAPLDAMTNLARSIARGRRGQRLIPARGDTEIGRTASAFDEMLDALEGAERHALEAQEAMRRFIADAAHELRTPIAGISAATEAVLAQSGDDPQTQQRLLLVLGREAHRAGRLVEDLLDLARLDSGLPLQPEPTDLRELAAAQLERARLLRPDLTFVLDGPVVLVTADPARIGQAIANLVNNAADATPAGGSVTVTVRQLMGFAELAVADTGPGVDPADRERIFDRLVRLDTARGHGAGAGLGLPIARGIARAHGGDLTCEPPPGQVGALFVLRLPTS
ncbi:HAMP domain-containing histidine kinase [Skermania sp. ID1734]|nr:HAMP domain-containing histidine kinase [Skermania sp. ID1734]